jgi:DNA-binding protein HU-beta
MAKKAAKKATKKTAKKAPKKAVKKAVKKAPKKAVKKAAKKAGKRTVLYSSKGKKLYAKRDGSGKFEDIQTYKRAHGQDIKRKAKAEA